MLVARKLAWLLDYTEYNIVDIGNKLLLIY